MKPICFFTIADANNMGYYEKLKNSLGHFHPDIPLLLWDETKIQSYNDPHFFYRATPLIAKDLLKEYETVVKIDADSIVCADLSDAWEGEFDVAVVNNSNPREFQSYPYQYRNIHPLAYVNCGFVVMKSQSFVDYWWDKCNGFLFNSQMREQDMLNDMVFDNHWKVKKLDEGDAFWGLASKGYWADIETVITEDMNLIVPQKTDLFLPKGEEGWPDKDKWIKIIHFAGGNEPNKMNLNTRFRPKVQKYLKEITS